MDEPDCPVSGGETDAVRCVTNAQSYECTALCFRRFLSFRDARQHIELRRVTHLKAVLSGASGFPRQRRADSLRALPVLAALHVCAFRGTVRVPVIVRDTDLHLP